MIKVDSKEYEKKIVAEKTQVLKEKRVIQYFSSNFDERPVVVSLNDSQGVNISFHLNRLAYPGIIARTFDDEYADTISVNYSSLLFNKTYHDMLANNISLKENKRLQIRGAVLPFKKAMKDFGFPEFLGNIGRFTRIFYRYKKGDGEIRGADAIKAASHPLVLYSSGANDLMRKIGTNPASIKKDLKPALGYEIGLASIIEKIEKRAPKEEIDKAIKSAKDSLKCEENNFRNCRSYIENLDFWLDRYVNCAKEIESLRNKNNNGFHNQIVEAERALDIVEKAIDPNTISEVLAGVREKIRDIYRLNNKAVICVMGIYVPPVADSELFRMVATNFNEQVEKMCAELGATYIDVSEIGRKHCFKGRNFHISPDGHEAVAHEIIEKLHDRIFGGEKIKTPRLKPKKLQKEKTGLDGLREDLCVLHAHRERKENATMYEEKRFGEIGSEIFDERYAAKQAKRDVYGEPVFLRKVL